SLEAWYTHIPGLAVAVPSTPADVAGLLRGAIRCDDPVVFMEHKNLWGLEGEAPPDGHIIPLGKARTVAPGEHLTIVSWSAMVHTCADAVARLTAEGMSAELIDLRTLWPWDKEAVYGSVGRTGRLLIVQEAVSVSGFGAEIAASVAQDLFAALRAPIRRLGAPRIPISYAPPLEDVVRVGVENIVAAARSLVEKEHA
ncbi:MAG: alpha-ketoacid dehydrogenase subunit beta, partial [SAR324 cluster bacterium]|nr:alpha-ketoacid dehydrogenase subunit beta [SAR324 cluster bacterium]